jgi:hypothetical protein
LKGLVKGKCGSMGTETFIGLLQGENPDVIIRKV